MARKYNKTPKSLCVPMEDRYPRGIALGIINFLIMFMPKTLAVRLVAMLFLSVGLERKKVAMLVECTPKTIQTLSGNMESEDVCGLLTMKKIPGRPPKASDTILGQIAKKVTEGLFSSLKQIASMVEISFCLKLSEDSIGRLLKKFNIRKLKCGSLPSKADTVEQRAFYDDVLHPLMEKAKQHTCELLFMDASHFVMGCDFMGYFYCLYRRFVKTLSGRKRYNVLGALNFVSKAVHTVTNSSYITSKQVCRMLVKIAKAYPGKEIHIVLDNAAYQRCGLVKKVAENLGIHLVFIPPYSPNLNLIERFWKFVKGELRTTFYEDFAIFCSRIDEIVASSNGKNKDRVTTLIGEKVQLFDDLERVSDEYSEQRRRKTARKKENTQAA